MADDTDMAAELVGGAYEARKGSVRRGAGSGVEVRVRTVRRRSWSGTVKLLAFGQASWLVATPIDRQSRRRSDPADIGPHSERAQPCGAILTGSDVVAAEMEEVGDLVVGGEETLCLPR